MMMLMVVVAVRRAASPAAAAQTWPRVNLRVASVGEPDENLDPVDRSAWGRRRRESR